MATRGVSTTVTVRAWNTSTNAYVTGDAANISLKWLRDGTSSTTTNSVSEVDSVNAPGVYKIVMTATETDCTFGVLAGKSSTANVSIFGVQIGFEYVPTAATTYGAFVGNATAALAVDASGRVDLGKILGTAVSSPATAGILDVNVKNINNAAAATPGASGGILIAGTNSAATSFTAGVTISNAGGDALTVTSSGTNGNGMNISGNGTGNGVKSTGGATGHGIAAVGGATSGDGINSVATTSGHGVTLTGVGTTKHGVNATGGSTTSDGIRATGGGVGHGINAQSGSGSTGNGINAASNATNGSGMQVTGVGTGGGLYAYAGSSGAAAGIRAQGGSLSGDGILCTTSSGHGINTLPIGTGKHGIFAQGAAASLGNAAGDGFHAVGGAASTSAGGTSGLGANVIGGDGAASTNGANTGLSVNGGGTTTVSGADAAVFTGTLNGNALTLTHAGTGKDFNATTTPLTLAKTTNITGFNDIAATAVVSSGAITTSGGAVSTVTTVTTATNLTNAPTAGDFTAAMKTSLNAATPASVTGAVGSVTGNVGGNVVGSVGSVTAAVTVGTVNGSASNIKKNQALSNFMFLMTDSTNHQPKTLLTVTATRSLDTAAFASCANAVSEVANGWYAINLATTDLNANNVALRFTATGADDRDILIVTQP